jgi:hypothetical protein
VKAGWGVERGSGRLREKEKEKDDGLGEGEGDKEIRVNDENANTQGRGRVTNEGAVNGNERQGAESSVMNTITTAGEIDTMATATATVIAETGLQDTDVLGDLNMDVWQGLDEQDGWMDWCRDWDVEINEGAFVGGGS